MEVAMVGALIARVLAAVIVALVATSADKTALLYRCWRGKICFSRGFTTICEGSS